jgi:hypothetical protein
MVVDMKRSTTDPLTIPILPAEQRLLEIGKLHAPVPERFGGSAPGKILAFLRR